MEDIFNGLCVGDAPSEPINLDQRQRLGAKYFAASCKPSLKSQQPPAGFSALLRRNFDLFGHAGRLSEAAQMTDGSVSDFHVRFQPRWKVFRNSARSCIISGDTNNFLRPSPSAA
jgi:hypothetical protein